MKYRFNRKGGYRRVTDNTVEKGRSNYEQKVLANLKRDNIEYEYEKDRIAYTVEHTYTPDIKLANGIYVELKGLFLPEDRTKHIEIQKQHPQLDIRFLFMKDQYLTKKKISRYSDWCKKHGFKYAFGTKIPKEWIKEKT